MARKPKQKTSNLLLVTLSSISLVLYVAFGQWVNLPSGRPALPQGHSTSADRVVEAYGPDMPTPPLLEQPAAAHINTAAGTAEPPASPRPQYKYVALSTPSGPLYASQPFLGRISASTAWQSFANSNDAPTIAVIDTGFALNHDSLKTRWATNVAETGTTTSEGASPNCLTTGLTPNKSCNNLDNDGNGYASDWRGWDFVHNSNNPLAGKTNVNGSAVFHGTMTAGLAGLLNPGAKIMPLEALDDDGVGYTDGVAAAVRYAADNGAKIISLSLGSTSDDPYLHQQIDYAIARGAVVVAAAGNSGCNCLAYPAAYPEVLSVGASDSSDTPASFSNYGPNLDVLAPGTAGDVCSTFYSATNATSAYSCSYSGTSFAAPIVSGLVAMLLQQYPAATPAGIISIITQSATKPAAMNGQAHTLTYGYGLIDAGASVVAFTIPPPYGQLLNKSSASLVASTLAAGAQLDSTCRGPATALCSMSVVGPSGQMIDLGQKQLDDYGGADFPWNAASFGLTPGAWTVTSTIQYSGQTTSSTQTLTISQ